MAETTCDSLKSTMATVGWHSALKYTKLICKEEAQQVIGALAAQPMLPMPYITKDQAQAPKPEAPRR